MLHSAPRKDAQFRLKERRAVVRQTRKVPRLVCILLIELCNVPLAPEIARRHHRVRAACAMRCTDRMEIRLMRYIEEGE
jgi:hypothetical protein